MVRNVNLGIRLKLEGGSKLSGELKIATKDLEAVGVASASACAFAGVRSSSNYRSLYGSSIFLPAFATGFTMKPSVLTSTTTLAPSLNPGISAITPVTRNARLFPHFLISVSTFMVLWRIRCNLAAQCIRCGYKNKREGAGYASCDRKVTAGTIIGPRWVKQSASSYEAPKRSPRLFVHSPRRARQ